ncbi:MAG: type VI secretion system tip protein VgrG [Gemmataceae bacterium]|nr:type VI secretion system tip protein VgrG [Planctomycetia bacterium]MBX3398548.1 type VI secretion system tip protein VgrG [Gemmataceae bacterium]
MATQYTQAARPLQISTPLGKDALLAVGFYGSEGISQLFQFTVDVKAARTTAVPFDKLMGQPISLELEMPKKQKRWFHGVCVRAVQAESDADFTDYQLELVPQFWLLTKRATSRIFQHITVPDILKKVFAGMDVEYQISGTFEKRDFCVQYRESDYNFASRLMEEEGIFYFFKHAAGKHTMVLGNTPQVHPQVPGQTTIIYKNVNEEASGDEDHIAELTKVQEHTSGKFTLWDHTFELPHQKNDADKTVTDSVKIGQIEHKLKVGDNTKLEIYDWPGEYAQRFDGIDAGGSPQPAELKKISPDSKRTVDLRMQQVASSAVRIQGSATARQMTSGFKFALATRPKDLVATPIKAEGEYVVTTVQHAIRVPANYRSGVAGEGEGFSYTNVFTALPADLPYRPARSAAKPVVSGTQTAVVVGPAGEEIFTDKYGRIKVQFHWDREGKNNADSSCWVRVAQISAGRFWGALSIPRIGQEVVVDFLEGDPDQPLCVGCVYNPDQMPRYTLPDEKTKSYIRTNSSMGGVGYNELRFEDKAGKEQVYIHAQRNMDERVRNDSFERIGNNRHLRVGFYLENDHKGDASGETKKGSQFEEVAIDQHLKVHRHKDEHVGGDLKLLVGGGDGDGNVDIHIKKTKQELIDDTYDLHVKKAVKELFDATYDLHVKQAVKQLFDQTLDLHVKQAVKELYDATYDLHVGGKYTVTVAGGADLSIGGDQKSKVSGGISESAAKFDHKSASNYAAEAGAVMHLKAGANLVLEAPMVTLKGAGGFVSITPAGVAIQGTMVLINSGGAAGAGPGASPQDPSKAAKAVDAADAKDAVDAKPTKPTDADLAVTGNKSCN